MDHASPHASPAAPRTPATWLILALNTVIFLALAAWQGGLEMTTVTIARWGGIMPADWMGDEYWRYLTAGFLHYGPLHIAANMICLIAWGVPLERIYGSLRFAALFLASIIGGSIGSVLLHEERFVGAGASGGISGLLGVLLMLTLLKRIGLPLSFFAINFALNIALALLAPGVDWQAHLAGFLTGMLMGAILRPVRIQ
jgi:membrane associated rhomboid family serine protease